MKSIRSNICRKSSLLCLLILTSTMMSSTAQSAGTQDVWQQVKERGVLRCGAAVTPPYVTRDPLTQEYGGVFVQLCKDFASKVLHVKSEFINTSWDNIVAGIQANRWDMGMSLSQTPVREKSIAFSAPVIYSSVTYSYFKKNTKVSTPTQLSDFDQPNITIAVMAGSIADSVSTKMFKKARIMRLPGSQEATMALLSHRADIYGDDIGTNMMLAAAHPEDLSIFKPNPELEPLPGGFGLRKDISQENLDLLNKFVNEMRQSGAVDELINQTVKKHDG